MVKPKTEQSGLLSPYGEDNNFRDHFIPLRRSYQVTEIVEPFVTKHTQAVLINILTSFFKCTSIELNTYYKTDPGIPFMGKKIILNMEKDIYT